MSVKLSTIELELMSVASQREDHAFDPPDGVEESVLLEIAIKLVAAGLAREVRAKTGAPVWRRVGRCASGTAPR